MLLLASASLQHGMHFESLLLVYVLICDIFIVYIYFYIAYFYFLEFIGTFFLKIPIFALMFMIKNIKKMQLAGCKAHVCFAWSLLVLFLIFFIWSFLFFYMFNRIRMITRICQFVFFPATFVVYAVVQ